MSKQQHRSDLGIISDVLETTMDYGMRGAVVSSIARGANLSHYTAVDKCQRLVEIGLMELKTNEKNQTYSITEKGIHFFHEMQKFIEIVEQVKIRC
jgi:predicted transcriptional regulator